MKKSGICKRVLAAVTAMMLALTVLAPLATIAYAAEPADDETYISESDSSNEEKVTASPSDGTWANQMMDTDLTLEPENPNNGVIVFCVASMPEDALNRTVRARVAYGPADETLAAVNLSGMNSFVGSVEL